MADSIINLIHLLAAVVWLGGAIFTKAILEPAVRQINPAEAEKLQANVAKKFKLVAWSSIGLLLITGYLKTPSGMMFDTSSQLGQILTVKHLLIVAVLILGAYMGMVAIPGMRRVAPSPGSAPSGEFLKANRQFMRLSMANIVIGVVILVCAAFLW